VGEYLLAKIAQKLFGNVWGNSVKNPSPAQIFTCFHQGCGAGAGHFFGGARAAFKIYPDPELFSKFS